MIYIKTSRYRLPDSTCYEQCCNKAIASLNPPSYHLVTMIIFNKSNVTTKLDLQLIVLKISHLKQLFANYLNLFHLLFSILTKELLKLILMACFLILIIFHVIVAIHHIFRSNHRRCSVRKGVLRNFANSQKISVPKSLF